MASETRAEQGAHPLALLGVGHAPALQHQLEVLGRGVASRGQPLEPADGGQLGEWPELLPQHVLQHLSLRDAQESRRRRCFHGGGRGAWGGAAFHLRTWGRTSCGARGRSLGPGPPVPVPLTWPNASRAPLGELRFTSSTGDFGEHWNTRQHRFSNLAAQWNHLGNWVFFLIRCLDSNSQNSNLISQAGD